MGNNILAISETGKIKVEAPEFHTENRDDVKLYKGILFKRVFDVVVCGFTLLIFSPILFLVALIIKLESKGSVFFVSKRVGAGYKVFDLYKFRTMSAGADSKLKDLANKNQYSESEEDKMPDECPECAELNAPCSPLLIYDGEMICENFYQEKLERESIFMKIKDDPRVTWLGKFLRKTSIDEIPQLINVVKGDMSLVGNRPLPLYEAEKLTTDERTERFLAPAGLTGLWQITKRGKEGMSTEERINLDNVYARNYSFWNDIKIILKTFPALIQKEDV